MSTAQAHNGCTNNYLFLPLGLAPTRHGSVALAAATAASPVVFHHTEQVRETGCLRIY